MTEPTTGAVRMETGLKRVRAYLGTELVADTKAPLLVWEIPNYPAYYIPVADVRAELMVRGEFERRPRLGEAELLDVKAGQATAARAARRYRDSPVAELRDAVRLDWAAMTEWLEEDELVYAHPRDPYKRVDILASSRRVRIELDGVTVAESDQPRMLFETGLPVRYYLPLTHPDGSAPAVGPEHAVPVQGDGQLLVGRHRRPVHPDLIWMYRTPLPESQKIAGLACFYNERISLYVDGELQPRPRSPFS